MEFDFKAFKDFNSKIYAEFHLIHGFGHKKHNLAFFIFFFNNFRKLKILQFLQTSASKSSPYICPILLLFFNVILLKTYVDKNGAHKYISFSPLKPITYCKQYFINKNLILNQKWVIGLAFA